MASIIVADEQEGRRNLLAGTLEREDYSVTRAGTLRQCEGTALATMPDVVLMDINMPGIGGLEATQKILQRQPEVQIIALTVYDGDPYTSRLLKIGASGYLTKGAHFDEMLRAIVKVNSGQKYISP